MKKRKIILSVTSDTDEKLDILREKAQQQWRNEGKPSGQEPSRSSEAEKAIQKYFSAMEG